MNFLSFSASDAVRSIRLKSRSRRRGLPVAFAVTVDGLRPVRRQYSSSSAMMSGFSMVPILPIGKLDATKKLPIVHAY